MDARISRMEDRLVTALEGLTRGAAPPTVTAEVTPVPTETAVDYALFQYNGRFSRLPIDFRMKTKFNTREICDLWFEGIPIDRISPFRNLSSTDIPAMSDKRLLTSMTATMTTLNNHLPANYALLSSALKDAAFLTAFENMANEIRIVDDPKKKKRIDQDMSFTTVYTAHILPYKRSKK